MQSFALVAKQSGMKAEKCMHLRLIMGGGGDKWILSQPSGTLQILVYIVFNNVVVCVAA
jgi:hypothetical protein